MVDTPLASYLKVRRITQTEFATVLSRVRGWPAYQEQVSEWCRGRLGRATEAQIELATRGAVRRADWAKWHRRNNSVGR